MEYFVLVDGRGLVIDKQINTMHVYVNTGYTDLCSSHKDRSVYKYILRVFRLAV